MPWPSLTRCATTSRSCVAASNNALKALADKPAPGRPRSRTPCCTTNPFYDALGDDDALRRQRIVKVLPQLKKLDGVLVTDEARGGGSSGGMRASD